LNGVLLYLITNEDLMILMGVNSKTKGKLSFLMHVSANVGFTYLGCNKKMENAGHCLRSINYNYGAIIQQKVKREKVPLSIHDPYKTPDLNSLLSI
jgi:hypothetical protein